MEVHPLAILAEREKCDVTGGQGYVPTVKDWDSHVHQGTGRPQALLQAIQRTALGAKENAPFTHVSPVGR